MEQHQDLISKIESLTVKELAELVKAMEEKFGITASVPMTAGIAGAAGASAAPEEKSTFDVILKVTGDQKVNVIKVVKEVTGLGLKEAKDIVDAAPKAVKQDLNKDEADELKKKLEAVGATVELQ